MLELVIATIAVWGLAWGIAASHLFARPRAWLAPVPLLGRLVTCPACVAFHLAAWPVLRASGNVFAGLVAGGYAAGAVYLIGRAAGVIARPSSPPPEAPPPAAPALRLVK